MTEPTHHKPHDPIAPAAITLNAAPAQAGDKPSFWQQYRWVMAGLGASALLVLLVVFVLPRYITPPDIQQAPAAPQANAPATRGPTESPWQDAQFARERRETQDLLAKLLARQKTLEDMAVERWGAESYQAATELAASADEHYRQQAFEQARQGYTDSLKTFDQLIERSETLFEESLASGEAALQTGDIDAAKSAFTTARAIKPQSEAAQQGLERSAALADVLAAIEQGRDAQRDGDLDTAREHYEAALALDPESTRARELLAQTRQALKDRDFSRHMSQGFAALGSEQYAEAADAFQRALAIKPGAADARNALTQAQDQQTQVGISRLIANAEAQESREQWAEALASYEQALALDSNLAAARVGKIRTGTRADIDKKLRDILAHPERLTTPSVHSEYQQLHDDISQLPAPRDKLDRQQAQLKQQLALAITPVVLSIKSDNETRVTLYRVSELGQFEETEITLKPGNYTLVGTRDGYRDVRREFTLSANDPNPTITIQCNEKITSG